jgi:hypothetical protein
MNLWKELEFAAAAATCLSEPAGGSTASHKAVDSAVPLAWPSALINQAGGGTNCRCR